MCSAYAIIFNMKKRLKGFTIIEVSLFLAITGLLFLGVIIGVQSSVFRQRFNDSVQNFAEFLRGVYAEAMNVQSADSGRSNQAIYGKLITFGEEIGFDGESVDENGNQAFVYDVVGNIDGDIGTGDVLKLLSSNNINADVIVNENNTLKLAGIVESYKPKWSAQIQPTNLYEPIKAALLIVRHPMSGTVYTFVMKDKTVEVNEKKSVGNSGVLNGYWNDFSPDKIDFCINPEGENKYDNRADVRINANARNSSAIEIIYEGDNPCR